MTAELDDGPILGQTPVAILPDDTAETLADRILIAEHQLYSRVLAEYTSRERQPDWLLEQIRTLALALPEADETVSHGMPCFGIVKGKKFAYFTQDHHGDGKTAILVKISGVDEQAMLIEADADRYYRPAYFGDGWIGIRLDLGDNDWAGIADWLRKSWIAIAPPKLRQSFAIADEFLAASVHAFSRSEVFGAAGSASPQAMTWPSLVLVSGFPCQSRMMPPAPSTTGTSAANHEP